MVDIKGTTPIMLLHTLNQLIKNTDKDIYLVAHSELSCHGNNKMFNNIYMAIYDILRSAVAYFWSI